MALWLGRPMGITVATPAAGQIESVLAALAGWQVEGQPVQLHLGDLGWHGRFGAEAVARSLRVWSRDHEMVAVGFLDVPAQPGEPAVIRMGLDPAVGGADEAAREVAERVFDYRVVLRRLLERAGIQ